MVLWKARGLVRKFFFFMRNAIQQCLTTLDFFLLFLSSSLNPVLSLSSSPNQTTLEEKIGRYRPTRRWEQGEGDVKIPAAVEATGPRRGGGAHGHDDG